MIIKIGSSKNRKIRIISGKWKGYKIPVVYQLSSVRPTTDRIRETLFNWIHPIITDAICLDCFAGTGVLGLEALSRGAQKVTFIDQNPICIAVLTQIIKSFKEYKSDVIYSDCRRWLRKSDDTYNIVFIDPPFYKYIIIPEVICLLEKHNHFTKKSWIYIESSRHQNIFDVYTPPRHWILYRKLVTQMIMCYLYFRSV